VITCIVVVGYWCFRHPCCLHLEAPGGMCSHHLASHCHPNSFPVSEVWTSHWYFDTWCAQWKLQISLPSHTSSTGCQTTLFPLATGWQHLPPTCTQGLYQCPLFPLPVTSLWIWRQHGHLKHYPTTTLHGVTTQKTSTQIFTAMKPQILVEYLFLNIRFVGETAEYLLKDCKRNQDILGELKIESTFT
jgi:hypothetical protein